MSKGRKHSDPPSARITESEEASSTDGASSIGETEVTLELVLEEIQEQIQITAPTGKVWEVTVIEAGTSLNGRHYSEETLIQSIPVWEGADICAYGFAPPKDGEYPQLDHVPAHIERAFPNGTFLNKVGFFKNVRGVREGGVFKLKAEFCCTDPKVRESILETASMGGRLPGFSIHAEGRTREAIIGGRRVVEVVEITKPKELTIVSDPAAGGCFERLVAGIPRKEPNEMKFKTLRQFMAKLLHGKALKEAVKTMEDGALLEGVYANLKEMGGDSALLELALKWLKSGKADEAGEVLEMAIAKMGGDPAPEPPVEADEEEDEVHEGREQTDERRDSITPAVESLQKDLADVRKIVDQRNCTDLLELKLSESHLPDQAKAQIRSEFSGRIFESALLESRIKNTKDLLAEFGGGEALIESGNNGSGSTGRIVGDPRITILYEGYDKIQMASDLLFQYPYEEAFKSGAITESQRDMYRALDSPTTYSPKNLYMAATGDFQQRNKIARGSILESATTASFPDILSTSMTKALTMIFKGEEFPDWMDVIFQKDVDSFKQQDRIVAGSFSSLPDIAEAAPYTDLGVPMELPTSYSLGKKGGFFRFTWESLLADDLGYFQSIIPAIMDAGLHTRDRAAYKLITGNGNTYTSYDGVVHYHVNHFNTGTDALSYASLTAAEQSIRRTRKPAFRTLLDGAIGSTVATTFIFDSTAGMQVGDYVRINAEILQVTSVTNTTTAELSRGALQTTATTHADNDPATTLGGTLAQRNLELVLVVPIALKSTADVIVGSKFLPGSNNNDVNPLFGRFQVLPVPEELLDGDFNNWYVLSKHRPGFQPLEFAYLNGQRSPEIVTQDQPSVGTAFTNDQITYRTRFVIGGKSIMHEGRFGSIVA